MSRPLPRRFGAILHKGAVQRGDILELNIWVRPTDRLKLKVLAFGDRRDGVAFFSGPWVEKYGHPGDQARKARAKDVMAFVYALPEDRGFFAIAAFFGKITLGWAAHEALHAACRYCDRVGNRKRWTDNGYEIGDYEEQRAFAASAILCNIMGNRAEADGFYAKE